MKNIDIRYEVTLLEKENQTNFEIMKTIDYAHIFLSKLTASEENTKYHKNKPTFFLLLSIYQLTKYDLLIN